LDPEEQARRPDAQLIAAADGGALTRERMRHSRPQRGWIGLIGLLLALVIVALLAQKVLKTYGLLQDTGPGAKSAAGRGARGAGEASAASMDATESTPAPAAAIERARGLESSVQQQAQDMSKRIDDAAK
jgi:hypothetical protein